MTSKMRFILCFCALLAAPQQSDAETLQHGPFVLHYVYVDDMGNERVDKSEQSFEKNETCVAQGKKFQQAYIATHSARLAAGVLDSVSSFVCRPIVDDAKDLHTWARAVLKEMRRSRFAPGNPNV